MRRTLWAFIAFCVGFYSANTVSLSFGALAINDIVAAILTVAFCEVCPCLSLGYRVPLAVVANLLLFGGGVL